MTRDARSHLPTLVPPKRRAKLDQAGYGTKAGWLAGWAWSALRLHRGGLSLLLHPPKDIVQRAGCSIPGILFSFGPLPCSAQLALARGERDGQTDTKREGGWGAGVVVCGKKTQMVSSENPTRPMRLAGRCRDIGDWYSVIRTRLPRGRGLPVRQRENANAIASSSSPGRNTHTKNAGEKKQQKTNAGRSAETPMSREPTPNDGPSFTSRRLHPLRHSPPSIGPAVWCLLASVGPWPKRDGTAHNGRD